MTQLTWTDRALQCANSHYFEKKEKTRSRWISFIGVFPPTKRSALNFIDSVLNEYSTDDPKELPGPAVLNMIIGVIFEENPDIIGPWASSLKRGYTKMLAIAGKRRELTKPVFPDQIVPILLQEKLKINQMRSKNKSRIAKLLCMSIMIFTACRSEQVDKIRYCDVQLLHDRLLLNGHGRKGEWASEKFLNHQVNAVTRKKLIPICPVRLFKLLQEEGGMEPQYFLSTGSNRQANASNRRGWLQTRTKHLSMTIKPHGIRSGIPIMLQAANVPEEEIRDFCGWRSIDNFKRYTCGALKSELKQEVSKSLVFYENITIHEILQIFLESWNCPVMRHLYSNWRARLGCNKDQR